MEQCKICKNREKCKKYSWCITMDNGYKFQDGIYKGEWVCDNFLTYDKAIIMKKCDKTYKKSLEKCERKD